MIKPFWLKKRISLKDNSDLIKKLSSNNLHTICQEAFCPNISECFSKGVATFLIMGDVCTRSCSFCSVKKGIPKPTDREEPGKVAKLIDQLDVRYAVITSVTRDDIPDKGASCFVDTIMNIKKLKKSVKIEVLIPDFDASEAFIKKVIDSNPSVVAHNIETVRSIYPKIGRDIDRYEISLNVLRIVKKINSYMTTKSGIMLGLGEKKEEVYKTMEDIKSTGCDFLSIGQYLAPSKKHFPVEEYIKPEVFNFYKNFALDIGFKYVKSGPYVRSSYLADEYRS